jgi:hypothetical protein
MSAPSSSVSTPSQLNTSISTLMSGLVLLAALAGLVVAIINLRKAGLDCGIRSLSMAYVIFFVLALLAAIGAGGALFRGTELGATAGVTLLTFMSASLFVLGALLFFRSSKITDPSLRQTNYAVFGIYSLISLINTGYFLYQRQTLVASQPVTNVVDYIRRRFDSTSGGSEAGRLLGGGSVPVRA